ncbi:MAG: hypothetical protein ACJ76Y_00405 [Thermoanaerobaculia bacterium]
MSEDIPEFVHPAEQVTPGRLVLCRGPRGVNYDDVVLKLRTSSRPDERLQDRHDIRIASRLSRIPDGAQPDNPSGSRLFEDCQDRIGYPGRVDDQDVEFETFG